MTRAGEPAPQDFRMRGCSYRGFNLCYTISGSGIRYGRWTSSVMPSETYIYITLSGGDRSFLCVFSRFCCESLFVTRARAKLPTASVKSGPPPDAECSVAWPGCPWLRISRPALLSCPRHCQEQVCISRMVRELEPRNFPSYVYRIYRYKITRPGHA